MPQVVRSLSPTRCQRARRGRCSEPPCLAQIAQHVLPFPVHEVSAGDLRADLLAGARASDAASIPAFASTVTPAGTKLPVYDEDESKGRSRCRKLRRREGR